VPEEISCQSIRRITKIDMEYADVLGCTIRQLSRIALDADCLQAAVGPVLVSKQSPLANVFGSQNLVVSTGEFGGDTVFSGFGAGGNPTAVAVVSDLLQVAKYLNRPAAAGHRPVPTKMTISGDYDEPHYVRFVVSDRPGVLAQLATIFAKHELNIDAVLQRPGYAKENLPFVVTLEPCLASRLRAALDEIAHFDFLAEPPFEMPILR
jgi:homoserine dehydrogenase